MTNITVRNEPGKKLATTQSPTWDPFRVFRSMMQWDPFQEMAPLMAQERLEFFPNFDVKETKRISTYSRQTCRASRPATSMCRSPAAG